MKKMTEKEIVDLESQRERVGAVGRNAAVCLCGHIDYSPNTPAFQNCVIHVTTCLECDK